jgi:hypothetical protein
MQKIYVAQTDETWGTGAQYGPFDTSGEAERAAKQLGWGYVTVLSWDDEVFVGARTYPVAPSIEQLRAVIAGVPPLSAAESKFFAFYEDQLNAPSDPKTAGR